MWMSVVITESITESLCSIPSVFQLKKKWIGGDKLKTK